MFRTDKQIRRYNTKQMRKLEQQLGQSGFEQDEHGDWHHPQGATIAILDAENAHVIVQIKGETLTTTQVTAKRIMGPINDVLARLQGTTPKTL